MEQFYTLKMTDILAALSYSNSIVKRIRLKATLRGLGTAMLASWVLLGTPSLAASIIDSMDSANGFFGFTVVQYVGPGPGNVLVNPTGYLLPTATLNGDGTVTLSVLDGHTDASDEIVNWNMPDGLSSPYMDLTANRFLQLNLTVVSSTRNYDVFLLYWGSGTTPTFLSETEWLNAAGSNNLNPQVDVSALAPVGAGQYFVRFRLFPTNLPGTVLTLDSIQTSDAPSESTPEPGTGWIIGLIILARFAGSVFAERPRPKLIVASGRL